MQTRLADFIRDTPEGRDADAILRKCVHCGFCTATCPTYQLLGDELDGPRGRIYLIKQLLEGAPVTARTQTHLDRCLTCRACETTCPSGVRYGRLADIGRGLVEERVGRPLAERIRRRALLAVIPHRARFAPLLALGRLVRPLLPGRLARRIPPREPAGRWPAPTHARRVLALGGCVQGAIAPGIDAAAARVLDRIGISYVPAPASGCCGAASRHLHAHETACAMMRRNIDAWWPEIEAGAEAVVPTASACAFEVKEYAELLRHDPAYAGKAERVSALARDLCEIVAAEDLSGLVPRASAGADRVPLAVHVAARAEAAGRGRRHPRTRGVRAHLGERRPPVLRIRRHLLHPAAGAFARPARAQDRQPGGATPADDRHREHRLPRAPRHRGVGAGAALDPAPGPRRRGVRSR